MTPGQQRAIRELKRIQFTAPDIIEIVDEPKISKGWLRVLISLRLEAIEMADDGLDLRAREDFILKIPPGFPFDKPSIKVNHNRFALFPHVIWRKWLCIYQSSIEWNPADGLFGFVDRLLLWLEKAALNDMDPYEGPLEPPHYNTDFSRLPFVIRANTPFKIGETWFGLAELQEHPNRIELIGWNDLSQSWPNGITPAIVIVLKEPMPPEFPTYGIGLFIELEKQGIDKHKILYNLRLASLFTLKTEPIYIVLALPMRRSSDGDQKFHIAIWSIDQKNSDRLRSVIPSEQDSKRQSEIKGELNDIIYDILKLSEISWCKIMEDRDEIIVRRDSETPMLWFKGKKILILGCGALGSWASEMIVRTNPELIHIVDNSIVTPGILVRQNFCLDDIGKNKAAALCHRIKKISSSTIIKDYKDEAHSFLKKNKKTIGDYDLIFDFTASNIFQMKLERDWVEFNYKMPPVCSIVIDGIANRYIGIILKQGSEAGIWSGYINLKNHLCLEPGNDDIVEAFYNTKKSIKKLFQPEPGCSDPTFVGSTADMMNLVSNFLNHLVLRLAKKDMPLGLAFSSHSRNNTGCLKVSKPPDCIEAFVGNYRVQINKCVFAKARAWVKQNNRIRTKNHETGGLLWGLWDDAIGIIWIFDASGPPSDSSHDPGHFQCGIDGTIEEHESRIKRSFGLNGFVGFWHTHPNMQSVQSSIDIHGMTNLVTRFGLNQKRSIMMIYGRLAKKPTVGIYTYDNISQEKTSDKIEIGEAQYFMEDYVV